MHFRSIPIMTVVVVLLYVGMERYRVLETIFARLSKTLCDNYMMYLYHYS